MLIDFGPGPKGFLAWLGYCYIPAIHTHTHIPTKRDPARGRLKDIQLVERWWTNAKTIQVLNSQLCLCNFQFSTPYPRSPATSFAYFPAIIICICEIFPAHCDSNSILIFRAQCNLQFAFFYDLFCQDRAPLYWSHNRTKWYEKNTTSYEGPLICIRLRFLWRANFLIDDAWKYGTRRANTHICIFD